MSWGRLGPAGVFALGLVLGLGSELWRAQRVARSEAEALQYLRTLVIAQDLGRTDRKGLDWTYLSMQELVDRYLPQARWDWQQARLRRGYSPPQGYVFDVRPSRSTPEFLWFGTASPEHPGITGRRYFAVNQAEVIFSRDDQPFEWNDDCLIPGDATPVQDR